MDTKQKKEERKQQLYGELDNQVAFLEEQISNLTKEFQFEVKKREDLRDALKLQSDALKDFKIK